MLRSLPRLATARTLLALALASMASLTPAMGQATQKQVFGWVERVVISRAGLSVEAKLDTGADTSSLHAENIERFKRDGVRMVRFEIVDPNTGENVRLERHLARMVRIREHDGGYQRRPVVRMWICLGTMRKRIDVNLVDRSRFNYPFLLGRSGMHGSVIIDPGRTFTAQPDCELRGMDQ